MESPKIVYKYYSNPAFCSQSEVIFAKKSCLTKVVSPDRRMPPLGGNSPRKIECNRIMRTDISDNPLRIPNRRDEPPELPPKPPKYQRQYQRQTSLIVKPSRSIVRCRTRSEDLEMAQFRQSRHDRSDNIEERMRHRYEVIDMDDSVDYSPTKKRIVEAEECDVEEYNVDGPDENEMKEIPTEIVKTVNGKTLRYAIVPSDDEERKNVTFSATSPIMSKSSLIATQKLHELLSTPRKLKSYASQPSVRITPNKSDISRYPGTPMKMISSTPTQVTPSKSCANLTLTRAATSPISPKALQKLNYGLLDRDSLPDRDVFVTSFKRERSFDLDRRDVRNKSDRRIDTQKRDKNTAVIIPRVAPQSPSVYSEDTYKSFSSIKSATGPTTSLTIAALILTLCGGLTSGLSFYMMYSMGRRYYLDFCVLSGFTCFLLGLLGLRSRRHQLLPNRNYISGYIVLSSFSLLSAFGLLILLSIQPKPGTALNDITSGAVCSVSVISLCLATVGILVSYCCARDPPDNRVGTARWY
nr:uncharacterized protein LOC113391829 [Vanessa tameamea]